MEALASPSAVQGCVVLDTEQLQGSSLGQDNLRVVQIKKRKVGEVCPEVECCARCSAVNNGVKIPFVWSLPSVGGTGLKLCECTGALLFLE